VAGSRTSFRVEVLTDDDWPRLRNIRLSALRDDPLAFLSTDERELDYDEQRWRQKFSRSEWNVMLADDQDVGLVGATREPQTPQHECDLEFLWIEPGSRRAGLATMLLRTVLDRLRDFGVRTIWVWILNGNDPTLHLYEQFGFQGTNQRQPLPKQPGLYEERMRLRLS
jgi:ribosomal protein S18 acetylase RimI-like enzyme